MIKRYTFRWIGILALLLFSCGGSLTQEQREKAKRAIEEGAIKRITPAQLIEAAMNEGKKIAKAISGKDPFMNDVSFLDSMATANEVIIYALRPGMLGLTKAEALIAEAYEAEGDITTPMDNVQKLEGDSLLYTTPISNERPDGSRPFSHAIAVKMAVKQLVLKLDE